VNGVPGPSFSNPDVELNGSSGQSATRSTESADFVAQRRWPRYCVGMTVQVRVTTQGPTRVVTWKGHGTDISAGGLAVSVDSNLPIGSQLGVEFTLPGSNQSTAFRCFVRNRDGDRYGLEFITENDEDYRNAAELQAILATMKTS
jgi:c-di-GMP-binding flagellar brake protein YcgR